MTMTYENFYFCYDEQFDCDYGGAIIKLYFHFINKTA